MPVRFWLAAWALFTGLNAGKDAQPFLAALSLFVLCFIGIGISFYPNIVPPGLTIAEAAAPDESLLLRAGGNGRSGADDPCLHRLRLLGVSRQD